MLGTVRPVDDVYFVDVLLHGTYDEHIALSNARNNLMLKTSLDTALEYFTLWSNYYNEYIAFRGSCTTRTRVYFTWSIQLLENERPVNYSDGSPLFELLCAASSVISHCYREKRSQYNDFNVHACLTTIVREWLPRFTPRLAIVPEKPLLTSFHMLQQRFGKSMLLREQRPREVYIFSQTFWRVYKTLIDAQECYAPYSVERKSDPLRFCSRLFAASACLEEAQRHYPAASNVLLKQQQKKLLSFAYQLVAEHLIETEHAALGVTCMQEARELLNDENLEDGDANSVVVLSKERAATLDELVETYTKRNNIENFSATIPTRAQIQLVFKKNDRALPSSDQTQPLNALIVTDTREKQDSSSSAPEKEILWTIEGLVFLYP